jgi:Arc/MetJ-type ribon-helix-helix transcriptional regulator
MSFIIQARLDNESRKRLKTLVRELGLTPSEVVREGIRALETNRLRKKKKAVIGMGQFASGLSDLGSNKKHLDGFGK